MARVLFERHASPSDPAWIDRIVVIETVWVSESVYAYAREEISAAIAQGDFVRGALAMYRRGADFADTMIATANGVIDR